MDMCSVLVNFVGVADIVRLEDFTAVWPWFERIEALPEMALPADFWEPVLSLFFRRIELETH
jgi:hypothetical protein